MEVANVNGQKVINLDGALVKLPKYNPEDLPAMTNLVAGILPDGNHAAFVAPCNLSNAKNFAVISRIDDPTCRWKDSKDPYPCDVQNMIKEFEGKGLGLVSKKPAFAITTRTYGTRPESKAKKPANTKTSTAIDDSVTINHPPDSRFGEMCYYLYRKGDKVASLVK